MSNKIIIGVDSGKYQSKSMLKEGDTLHRVQFRTKVMETNSDIGNEFNVGNTYRVEFQGKTFILGDSVSEEKTGFQLTKNTTEHILSIYISICHLLSKLKTPSILPTVYLACNIPIHLYKAAEQKLAYEEAIRNGGEPICITINGQAHIFRIEQILLLPEGLGPVYENPSEYRSKRVSVIDLGGLNASFMQINQLSFQYDSMVSSAQGINMLRSKFTDVFSSKYGVTITENDAEQMLRDKCFILQGQKEASSVEIIHRMFVSHLLDIINFGLSRGFSFNNDLLFCGGGSILLKDYILRKFPSATICDDPIFGNLRSYLKVAEAKWRSLNSQ
jgi:plasmid segregation protein ParM